MEGAEKGTYLRRVQCEGDAHRCDDTGSSTSPSRIWSSLYKVGQRDFPL